MLFRLVLEKALPSVTLWLALGCSSNAPPAHSEPDSGTAAESAPHAVGRLHESPGFRVALPADSSAATRIESRAAPLSLSFRLRESRPGIALEATPNGFVFAEASSTLGDVRFKLTRAGVEDEVVLRHPPALPAISYELGLAGVAGLRLVANTLEFLDAAGAPRLRVAPPTVIDAAGGRRAAELELTDCRADRDPRAPYSRAVTAPGSDKCTLRVSWEADGLGYPLVVDPAWEATGDLVVGRSDHTAELLASGLVLVAGGGSASAELFDPATRTFAATGSMSVSRQRHASALLGSGQVLVAGGYTSNPLSPLASSETYDPGTGTWTPRADMAAARFNFSATTLSNGRVLLVGGRSTAGAFLKSSELYDPAAGGFSPGPDLSVARGEHSATVLSNGQLLIAFGFDGNGALNSAERYTVGGSFAAAGTSGMRAGHSATLLQDGRVVVAGGHTGGQLSDLPSAAIYTPSSNTWASLPDMPQTRRDHRSVLLGNGNVLVAGGTAAAEQVRRGALLSTSSLSWQLTTAFQREERRGPTLTVLPSGDVLMAGGDRKDAEVYCVSNGCSCSAASEAECLSGHCADGVCCDTACQGTCRACTQAFSGGPDGTCQLIPPGSDPQGECNPQSTASCGRDGFCDGAGACRLHGSDVECGAPGSCADSSAQNNPQTCDGSGSCVDRGQTPCGRYSCDSAAGKCNTNCLTTDDCGGAFQCIAGECMGLPVGTVCASDAVCDSGHCADGVCCNSSCDRQCEACNVTGSLGACLPVSGDPVGSQRSACGGSGVCAGRCDGSNPAACTFPGGELSCGVGMSCDKGECVRSQQLCVDGGLASQPVGGAKQDCAGYRCDESNGMCRTRCDDSTQCAPGFVCGSAGCVAAEPPQADSGCACHAAAGGAGRSGMGALLLVLALAVRRVGRETEERKRR